MGSLITTDLSEARILVEGIQGPQDQWSIAKASSVIDSIQQRFSRGEGLEHIESFLDIQAIFEQKVKPQPERTVDRSAVSRPSSHSVILAGIGKQASLPGRRILGSINQYSDGTHPTGTFSRQYREACSSTTLAFVSRFLNHGTAGLDGGKIDQLIRTGQDNFLPLIRDRAAALDGMLISEDKQKGKKLKAHFEENIFPVASSDKDKRAYGKINVYGASFNYTMDVKGGKMILRLMHGKEVLRSWEGSDLTQVSEDIAQDMLRKARQIKKDENPLFRGNMMTPVEALPRYSDFIGERPHTPESFFLASKKAPSQTLEQTRKGQIREMISQEILPLANLNPHGRVAATITINGQILGIGLEKRGEQVTITLFDSHGNESLHGRSEGYAYTTGSIDDAATTLLNMMRTESTEIEVNDLSEEERKMIEADQATKNEVSLWLALPKEEIVPFLENT